jgi:phosphoribosylaminoimidazole-succinocarboxamide synthase
MVEKAVVEAYLDDLLWEASIPELGPCTRGKVRDNYDLAGGRRLMIATDRLSAFDRVLTAIPLKGQALTELSRFWFEATGDLAANHVIDYPDPNVLLCRKLKILPVEIVVRDYLAGTTATSLWTLYKAGQREIYGHRLPDGLRENEKLPRTIITPTTKAGEGAHDRPMSEREILESGLLTSGQWREVSAYALALFERGRRIARERGLILADTKYEFGIDEAGRILLADEIHTPDSSRYWLRESYEARFRAGEKPESLDKDRVRNWVAARCDPYRESIPPIPREVILESAHAYIAACEEITGKPFRAPPHEVSVLARIRANLARFF